MNSRLVSSVLHFINFYALIQTKALGGDGLSFGKFNAETKNYLLNESVERDSFVVIGLRDYP